MKKRFNDGICWQEETCKVDRVREKNVLWTNRIEISVKKNCIYRSVARSVGAYSCHEDNLTFNIHHNSAMRVHFDWHMSALSSFILLHFTSNWFVRFMTTIAVWCTILIVYIHAIHFSSFFFIFVELLLLTIITIIHSHDIHSGILKECIIFSSNEMRI